MEHSMQRSAVCVWLCVAWSFSAFGYIDSVAVLPAEPTSASDIVIRIDGGLPDSCWEVRCHSITIDGRTIAIDVSAELEGDACAPVVVPYTLLARLGRLTVGTYTVEVTDQWDRGTFAFDVTSQPVIVPGDANSDGVLNIADAVFVLGYLFASGPAPACESLANTNADAKIDIADAVFILGHLFASGPAPMSPVQCSVARDCAGQPWLIFCVGHWECVCGECRAVCDNTSCGDGYCDYEGGETPENCPDCKGAACRPVCLFIGTRSEGWYDPCDYESGRPALIDWAFCADCVPVCRACGSKSEGWYDSCTGELIEYADCDCECE